MSKIIIPLITFFLIMPIFIVCYNILFFHFPMPDNALDISGAMATAGVGLFMFFNLFNAY